MRSSDPVLLEWHVVNPLGTQFHVNLAKKEDAEGIAIGVDGKVNRSIEEVESWLADSAARSLNSISIKLCSSLPQSELSY